MTTTTTRDPFGPEGVKARQDWEDGAAADIEQWYWVRARWVVDLLRSGMNVAVIGVCGMGKSTVMHYVEKTMLPEHDGLTDRVRFFYEWKGCGRLPKRSPGELFVVEVSRFEEIPAGFGVVPLLPLWGPVKEQARS